MQEMLDTKPAPSTHKFYVPAITANHSLEAGQSVGRNDLVVEFLKGARRLKPPCPQTEPTWDLSIVLRALWALPLGHSIRPICSPCRLRPPSFLALASVKRVGDLHALLVSASCLEFGPNDYKVVLKPRQGYVPKVL